MNLNRVTPKQITDKFNIWLNRFICDALRKHKQTGKQVVDKINIQVRPKNIYEVKKFIEKLKYILPTEESIADTKGLDWYFRFKRDIRRWESITEKLTSKDYIDVSVKDVVEYMIEDESSLSELLDIVMEMDCG